MEKGQIFQKCRECKELKLLDQFRVYKGSGNPHTKCKKCEIEYTVAWYKAHPEKGKAHRRKYVENNYDRVRETQKRYAETHAEEIKAKRKARYKKSPEKERAQVVIWQEDNMNKVREAQRYWINRNYNRNANFRLTHLIRTRTNHAVKRYLQDGHITESPKGDINYAKIIEHLGPCPGEYGRGTGLYTIDHIIPLRLLILEDPLEWAIAVHPKNVQWSLWEDNYKRKSEWTLEIDDLYQEIRKEVIKKTLDDF